MNDTEPQTAGGKVLWHFTMSLDGFVAGPNHEMDWMTTGMSARPGLIDEIDLHIAPVLLGDGIRLYDNPGAEPVRLHRVGEGDPTAVVNVRYRPNLLTGGSPSDVKDGA
jgi:riboflavin biosynthesis pyrimidine reductase